MSVTYTIDLAHCRYLGFAGIPIDNSPEIGLDGNISSSAGKGEVINSGNSAWYGLLAQGWSQKGVEGLRRAIASVFVGNVLTGNQLPGTFFTGFAPINIEDLKGPFPPPSALTGNIQFGGVDAIALAGSTFTVTI